MNLKRLLIFALGVAILAAAPLSDVVEAQKKKKPGNKRVTVCHFPDGKEIGRIITVSSHALKVHIKMHGDTEKFTLADKSGKTCRKVCKFRKCRRGEIFDKRLCRCVKKEEEKDPPKEEEPPKEKK